MKRVTRVAIGSAVIGIGLVAYWLVWRPSPTRTALRLREVAARGLADAVGRQGMGGEMLVVANPFSQRPDTPAAIRDTEAAGLRGLAAGSGPALKVGVVAYPRLKPEAAVDPRASLEGIETTTPLSYLVSADAFDTLLGEHPSCDLVVSLIGLPADLARVQCWSSNGSPRFALLLPDLRVIGNTLAVRHAFRRGKLAAFVLPRPDAPGTEISARSDWKAEFAKRFLLVTEENVDQMVQQYPALFP